MWVRGVVCVETVVSGVSICTPESTVTPREWRSASASRCRNFSAAADLSSSRARILSCRAFRALIMAARRGEGWSHDHTSKTLGPVVDSSYQCNNRVRKSITTHKTHGTAVIVGSEPLLYMYLDVYMISVLPTLVGSGWTKPPFSFSDHHSTVVIATTCSTINNSQKSFKPKVIENFDHHCKSPRQNTA